MSWSTRSAVNSTYAPCYAASSSLFGTFHGGCIRSLTLQLCVYVKQLCPRGMCQNLSGTSKCAHRWGWNQNLHFPEQMWTRNHSLFFLFLPCFLFLAVEWTISIVATSSIFVLFAFFKDLLNGLFKKKVWKTKGKIKGKKCIRSFIVS